MRTLGCIVVKQSGCGDERHYLEDGTAEGVLYGVMVLHDKLHHDEQRGAQHKEQIEAKLAVLEQALEVELGHGEIEQGEVDARQEAEDGTHILLADAISQHT